MAKEKQITVIMSLHEIDLAQKISDKILCVKGDRISHYGRPEEIFGEETIRNLYEIDNGFYDPCFGSIELPRAEGRPKAFVISSGGTGIPVYRRLQKEGIPFAAGILYQNDIDYQLARLLAVQVISEKPFEEITDETYHKALACMRECEYVINAGVAIGSCNRRMEELLKEAQKQELK
jgi:iron complex transport system ATP-binding protein